MKVATAFVVEPMRVEHIAAVSAIEKLSFPQPWPQNAYRREILENRMAHYVVARRLGPPAGADSSATEPADQHSGAEAGRAPASSQGALMGRLSRLLRQPEPPRSPQLQEELRSIVGYAGIWVMTDEAHVTTIASARSVRGQGVGEFLLVALIHRGIEVGARWMTLEVRASNSVAQNLYRKYTFKEMGVRRRYYSDNGEDALVMWTDALDSESFQTALEHNERKLAERLGSAEVRLGGSIWSLANG
ncbi:MAG: ribosomal protein S18-alanine N-acetyltransferase [Chloroflexi bacterium]|nr:ribosomal protein S18-alanine N-acetyltransferase [Chloroflexota bacterium]